MQRKPILILACVLIITLACTIDLGNATQPPPVVTQVIILPADTATTAPIQPTAEIPPAASPLPSITPLPTLTSSPVPSATLPGIASATLIKNANCRAGPGQAYEVITSFFSGQVLEITGRNPDLDNTWWQVKIPGTNSKCWISLTTAQASGNFDDIPTIYPPY